MSKPRLRLEKLTIDKDLDKVSRAEEASQYVMRGLAAPGLGLLFLVLSMAFAASYFTGASGLGIVVAGAAIAAYMAMNIGANDVTNNVGAAVGAKAMTMATALGIAAVFEIAGAVIAGRKVTLNIEAGNFSGQALHKIIRTGPVHFISPDLLGSIGNLVPCSSDTQCRYNNLIELFCLPCQYYDNILNAANAYGLCYEAC